MEWRRHILDCVVNFQHRHESIRERKGYFPCVAKSMLLCWQYVITSGYWHCKHNNVNPCYVVMILKTLS